MIEGIGQRAQSTELDRVSTISKEPGQVASSHFSVFCLPAADQADEIGARLFVELLKGAGIPAECAAVETLAGEIMELVVFISRMLYAFLRCHLQRFDRPVIYASDCGLGFQTFK